MDVTHAEHCRLPKGLCCRASLTPDTCPFLQTGHYTSVFLDNASGSSLVVRSGSHFSAILLGL